MNKIARRLAAQFLYIFSGWRVLLHFAAIGLTFFFVATGFDWWYFKNLNGSTIQKIFFPAVILGGLVPIIMPVVLYIVGKVSKNSLVIWAAFLSAEAAIMGWFVSALYKSFTGRVEPPLFSGSLVDNSREFLFGFWRHGIFWGWPSSHTTVVFALAAAFWTVYRDDRRIKIISILFAFFVGIGVSMSIHWFSDFAAGAIVGSLMGYAVGRQYRKFAV